MRTRNFAVVAIAGLMTACGSTQPVVTYQTRFKHVPSALTLPCDVAEPPPIEQYVQATWPQKEQLWKDAYTRQTLNVGTCNVRLKGVRDWDLQQGQIYDPAISPVTGVAQ